MATDGEAIAYRFRDEIQWIVNVDNRDVARGAVLKTLG
jgi:hypothetical protein